MERTTHALLSLLRGVCFVVALSHALSYVSLSPNAMEIVSEINDRVNVFSVDCVNGRSSAVFC